MSNVTMIEGDLRVERARVAIAVTRFNGFVTEALLNGALDTLRRSGIADSDITVVRVPGCYEMPLVVDRLASSGNYDGIVALGCVIRGATAHFEYVAGECSRGLGDAMRRHGLPVALGVVTTETIEQALERAGVKAGNKGADAAASLLEMISLMGKL
jgi:6,7-dimethyl-8-ribityllumazine synthase